MTSRAQGGKRRVRGFEGMGRGEVEEVGHGTGR